MWTACERGGKQHDGHNACSEFLALSRRRWMCRQDGGQVPVRKPEGKIVTRDIFGFLIHAILADAVMLERSLAPPAAGFASLHDTCPCKLVACPCIWLVPASAVFAHGGHVQPFVTALRCTHQFLTSCTLQQHGPSKTSTCSLSMARGLIHKSALIVVLFGSPSAARRHDTSAKPAVADVASANALLQDIAACLMCFRESETLPHSDTFFSLCVIRLGR